MTSLDFSEVFREIKSRLNSKSAIMTKRFFEKFRLQESKIRVLWRRKIHKEEVFSIRADPGNRFVMTTSVDKNVGVTRCTFRT